MASIHKRPPKIGAYYLFWYEGNHPNGKPKQHTKCLHTRNRREAEKAKREKERELIAKEQELLEQERARDRRHEEYMKGMGKYAMWLHRHKQELKYSGREDIPVDEFWEMFTEWCEEGGRAPNTLIAYRTAWRKLQKHIAPRSLNAITPLAVNNFKKKCREEGVSQAGIHQYLVCIQGMIKTAIRQKWYSGECNINLEWDKRQEKVSKFLTEEKVEILLTTARDECTPVYLFIAIAVHTGMRKDEVANLRWEDIDLDRCERNPDTGVDQATPTITLQAKDADPEVGIQEFHLKGKLARTIPVKKELRDILEPHRKEEGYVIESLRGGETKRHRYNLPRQFDDIRKKAGVKCTAHLLRHTFASWAARNGVSIYKISAWLGHSTVQLTADTYAHLQKYDPDINRF